MGYDMYLVEKDPAVELVVKAAEAAFDQAVANRDRHDRTAVEYAPAQAQVLAASDAVRQADTNYFRLNISGMGSMLEAMHGFGMLDLESKAGPWPEVTDFDLAEWPDSDAAHLTPAQKRFLAASGEVRAAEAGQITGIPIYKFGSNDGWVVTPAELTYALKMLETADKQAVDKVRDEWRFSDSASSYFDAWIAFLRRAAASRGFEVH